jgi:hypothetical protein
MIALQFGKNVIYFAFVLLATLTAPPVIIARNCCRYSLVFYGV